MQKQNVTNEGSITNKKGGEEGRDPSLGRKEEERNSASNVLWSGTSGHPLGLAPDEDEFNKIQMVRGLYRFEIRKRHSEIQGRTKKKWGVPHSLHQA